MMREIEIRVDHALQHLRALALEKFGLEKAEAFLEKAKSSLVELADCSMKFGYGETSKRCSNVVGTRRAGCRQASSSMGSEHC